MAILHRDGTFVEVDDEERRCAGEIQEGLSRLGVRPGTWSGAESLKRGR